MEFPVHTQTRSYICASTNCNVSEHFPTEQLSVFCLVTNTSQFSSQSARYCSATRLVNGKPQFLDPQGTKTPEPIDMKLDRGDYVGDLTPHAYFCISTL